MLPDNMRACLYMIPQAPVQAVICRQLTKRLHCLHDEQGLRDAHGSLLDQCSTICRDTFSLKPSKCRHLRLWTLAAGRRNGKGNAPFARISNRQSRDGGLSAAQSRCLSQFSLLPLRKAALARVAGSAHACHCGVAALIVLLCVSLQQRRTSVKPCAAICRQLAPLQSSSFTAQWCTSVAKVPRLLWI